MKQIISHMWNPEHIESCAVCGTAIMEYFAYHLAQCVDPMQFHLSSIYDNDSLKLIPVICISTKKKSTVYHVCCNCWEQLKNKKKSEIYAMFEEKENE